MFLFVCIHIHSYFKKLNYQYKASDISYTLETITNNYKYYINDLYETSTNEQYYDVSFVSIADKSTIKRRMSIEDYNSLTSDKNGEISINVYALTLNAPIKRLNALGQQYYITSYRYDIFNESEYSDTEIQSIISLSTDLFSKYNKSYELNYNLSDFINLSNSTSATIHYK